MNYRTVQKLLRQSLDIQSLCARLIKSSEWPVERSHLREALELLNEADQEILKAARATSTGPKTREAIKHETLEFPSGRIVLIPGTGTSP